MNSEMADSVDSAESQAEESHIRVMREKCTYVQENTMLTTLLGRLWQDKILTLAENERIEQIQDREGTSKAASALVMQVK